MSIPKVGAIGLFIAMLPICAQDRRVNIVGILLDPLGMAVPRASVELQSEASRERVAQANTDDSGIYRFMSIPRGKDALKLHAAGFAQLAVEVDRGLGF